MLRQALIWVVIDARLFPGALCESHCAKDNTFQFNPLFPEASILLLILNLGGPVLFKKSNATQLPPAMLRVAQRYNCGIRNTIDIKIQIQIRIQFTKFTKERFQPYLYPRKNTVDQGFEEISNLKTHSVQTFSANQNFSAYFF